MRFKNSLYHQACSWFS